MLHHSSRASSSLHASAIQRNAHLHPLLPSTCIHCALALPPMGYARDKLSFYARDLYANLSIPEDPLLMVTPHTVHTQTIVQSLSVWPPKISLKLLPSLSPSMYNSSTTSASRRSSSWAYASRDPRPVSDDDVKGWMLMNLRRKRLLSGPMVDIYVGKQQRHWSLHRNLLCHASDSLASELLTGKSTPALNTSSKKRDLNGTVDGTATDDNRLELTNFDPAGFELFLKWLYQGRIDDVSTFSSDQQKYEYAVACHKLYLLCDRFELPYLKNIAIDQYRRGLSETRLVPDAEEINQIYRESPSNSPFRKLMVRIAARQLMDPESDKNAETYRMCFADNPDFAVDLFNTVKGQSGGLLFDDPTENIDCEYHDHDNGVNCHNKGKTKAQGK